jgi:hypothetical protein
MKFYLKLATTLTETLQMFIEAEQKKRPKVGETRSGCCTMTKLLLTRHCSSEFLAKHKMISVPQPLYSSDLSPVEFFSLTLKSTLKGSRFQVTEEIEENSLQDLLAIPQNVFQDAFQNCKKCWKWYIDGGGGVILCFCFFSFLDRQCKLP